MTLSEVSIDFFRSIKECRIRLNEITAIIGENNAGKTALLRAINSVFNWNVEERYFLDNTHQYAVNTGFCRIQKRGRDCETKTAGDSIVRSFQLWKAASVCLSIHCHDGVHLAVQRSGRTVCLEFCRKDAVRLAQSDHAAAHDPQCCGL